MAAVVQHLIDTSALARMHKVAVRDTLAPVISRGVAATCGMVETELLYSARNVAEHDHTRQRLRALEWLATPDEVWSRVAEIQRALTERGQHRAVAIPDLVIAATAERHGVGVLHYDAVFDLIAAVTGQSASWVVPRGSADV